MPAMTTASTIGRPKRKPKTYSPDRVCGNEGCTVRLSRYNRAEQCFNHAPARFPRLRGEYTEEFVAKQG